MPNLVQQVFPVVASGELELTLNLPSHSVALFLAEQHGRCFRSADRPGLPGESVVENVERLYRVLGMDRPQQFASLALRTEQGRRTLCQTLAAYGTMVLRLDLERLGPELIIVNGDFKNVAQKIAVENDDTYAERIQWSDRAKVAGRLRELFANGQRGARPRILGSYVEARLPRPLVLDDVASVHVDPLDDDAIAAAKRLCAPTED